VRDGDPDALAGLCDVRGPAVFAYCEVVAGRGERAAAAAAAALGSFRAGVVATGDLATLNPEALLISATRHTAARYASTDVPHACARVPGLLAARADRSITLSDHDWLEEHLKSCWSCRAPVARFKVADKAYSEPPDTPLPADVKAAMVAAMTAAAPIHSQTADVPALAGQGAEVPHAEPAPASTNGNAAHAGPEHAPPAEEPYTAYDLPALEGHPGSSVDQPTSAFELSADDAELPELSADAQRERRRRTRRRGGKLGALGAGLGAGLSALGAGESQAASAEPGAARQARAARRSRPSRATAAPAGVAAPAVEAAGTSGASLPRPRRQLSAARSNRRRGALRPAVVLPVALVVIAIIAALAIAGVFGGGEPASSPQSYAPAPSDAPTSTQAAPVVVVPGAKSASAAAVEKAKARARAAKNKKQAAATTTPAATESTDANAAAPPPPPPPPAANPAPPPASPAKAGKPKIDAGNGATGAEQLPPAKDTSTVPDLAPPVTPVAPPPG
jgi:hypothetical protein